MELRPANGVRPLAVYTPNQNPDGSACSYYRVATPLRTLQELGLIESIIDDGRRMKDEERAMALAYTDLQLYYLLIDRNLLHRFFQFQQWKPNRDFTGLIRKPPAAVYDSDDHIEYCDIFNPKFAVLGTHLPDGRELEPGMSVHVDLANGETITPWVDGQHYPDGQFNIADNWRKLRLYKMLIRQAAGVTVSTEKLAEVYRGYGAKNVHVFPNSLRRVDYPDIRVERPRRKVRVMWQGGHSHFPDWHPLREALGEVFRARPNAEMVVWGMLFPGVHREIPEGQLKYIPWNMYEKYAFRLATIGHHINVCPLARGKFNECKSNIKFLESSAITRPAATLAADLPPYQDIVHGDTGLLYDPDDPADFRDKLIALIDDSALRQELSSRAHEFVWDKYEATKTVPALYRFYQDMKDAQEESNELIPLFRD